MIGIINKSIVYLVVILLFAACVSDSTKANKVSVQEKVETKTKANQSQVQEPEIATFNNAKRYPRKEDWILDRTYNLTGLDISGVAAYADSIIFVSDVTQHFVLKYNTVAGNKEVIVNECDVPYLNLQVARLLMPIADKDSIFVYRGPGPLYKFKLDYPLSHPTYFDGSSIKNFTIVDQGNHRLLVSRDDKQSTIGEQGSGPLEFESPSTLVYLGNSIFVSDTGNKRIQAIDLQGNYERSIAENTMESPTAMATDNQIIFVLDRSQRKVFLFNIQGELLYAIDKNLDDPRDIYFLRGELFVSDSNGQVKVFANNAHYHQ